MSKDLIKGYVAKILNTRELVINKGSSDGVKIGMVFTVYDKNGENIKDPKTGDILGSIKRPKVEVKVTLVEPKLCIAQTFKSRRVNVGGSGSSLVGIAQMFQPPKYEDVFDTLKTDEKTWEDLSESESFVKSGDPVEGRVLDKPRTPSVSP